MLKIADRNVVIIKYKITYFLLLFINDHVIFIISILKNFKMSVARENVKLTNEHSLITQTPIYLRASTNLLFNCKDAIIC